MPALHLSLPEMSRLDPGPSEKQCEKKKPLEQSPANLYVQIHQ